MQESKPTPQIPIIQKVEISFSTIFKTAVLILAILLISRILDIIILVFITATIVAGLRPMINSLKKRGVPVNISTLLVFFSFIITLGLILYLVLPPLFKETWAFISNFSKFVEEIIVIYNLQDRVDFVNGDLITSTIQQLAGSIGSASTRIISLGAGIFSGVITIITGFALVFYQLIEGEKIRKFIVGFFQNQTQADKIYLEVERKLGSWIQGQLFLMFIIGSFTYLALIIIGIWFPTVREFAVPLAIIAGLLEAIPILGPTLALIPALFVGATVSPQLAGIIFFTYIGIQQLEANIIIPKVMKDAVGVDSLIVILSIMIGSALLGALGALIAVPVAATIMIFYQEWQKSSPRKNQQ
jgi:predicted PurR-regulated permease PerM